MAKKKGSQAKSKQQGDGELARVMKLRLKPEEVQRVRVAAAIRDQRPAVFAREVVLEQAELIIRKFRE